MQRRTVQDPQRTSSSATSAAARGTVAKAGPRPGRRARGPLRRTARAAAALAVAVVGLLVVAAPGAAQGPCPERNDRVMVVEVDGLIDPVLADLIERQVADAADTCPLALVLQFDSGGAVISDGEMDDLVATIEDSPVPVAVWVGPSGSKAADEAVRVLAAADLTGGSVGSSVEVTPALLEARGLEPGDLGTVAVGDRVGAQRAVEL